MRLEAFSALAYGAQGLVYWFYGYRQNSDTEKYIICPTDINGNKTIIWNRVQTVNKEIKKYNDIFYGCTVKDIIVGTNTYSGNGPVESLISSNGDILVSNISNNGYEYLVIVSSDAVNSKKVNLKFTKDYNKSYLVSEMTSNFNFRPEVGADVLSRIIDLEPGGYAILRWKKI